MITSIGRYKIQGQIGSGSMGNVYRALDGTLEREIALKAIATGPSLDPDLKERFYREARLCARLNHPNIVTVYDLGEADGYAYIVMELLRGSNLKQLIENKDSLPLSYKLEAVSLAAEGLAHAHRSGLVHRDLKPSNLFRLDSGEIKILDFGIARMPASMLTVAGLVLGTPNYMAPEQILGHKLDGRADLFSLAIVLFSWLTFEHPFRSESIPKRIASESPDRLLDLFPEGGTELDGVIAKALSRDPNDRYQTGDDFAHALRQVAESGFREGAVVATIPKKSEPPVAPVKESSWEPPPGIDAAEWRITKFLELLQEFDEAYESRALTVASEALKEIESLAAVDDRFGIAAAEYRSRLQDLETALKPSTPLQVHKPVEQATPTPRPVPPPVQVSATPVPLPPVSLPVKIDASDATRLLTPPELQSAQAPPPPVASGQISPPIEQSGPAISPLYAPVHGDQPSQPAPVRDLPSKRGVGSLLLKVAAAVAILGAIVLLARPLFRSQEHPIALSFGIAEVVVDNTKLMSGEDGSGSTIATLNRGDKVNVLTPAPNTRGGWTQAQYVGGKQPSQPGYLAKADLGKWSRFDLLRSFDPGGNANAGQRTVYIGQLQELLNTAAPEEADTVRMSLAAQKLELARLARANRESRERVAALVSEGELLIRAMGAATQEGAEAQNLLRSLQEAGDSGAAAQDDKKNAASNYSPEFDFSRAENAFENGDYARVKRALGRILQNNPSNEKARKLLDRARAAKILSTRRQNNTMLRNVSCFLVAACLLSMMSVAVFAQTNETSASAEDFLHGKPFTYDQLLRVVGPIAPRRLVLAIQNRKVNFAITSQQSEALQNAGAAKSVLDAIRMNGKPDGSSAGSSRQTSETTKNAVLIAECQPAECAVFIDGQPLGFTTNGRLRLAELAPRSLVVSFRKDGYLTQEFDENLEPGSRVLKQAKLVLDPKMQSEQGSGMLASMIQALGGEPGLKAASSVKARGDLNLYTRDGQPHQWTAQIDYMAPDSVSFKLKGATELEALISPKGYIENGKLEKDPLAPEINADIRLYRDYQLPSLIERIRKTSFQITLTEDRHGFVARSAAESYIFKLGAELLPESVEYRPGTGLGSGVQVTYTEYFSEGGTKIPKTMVFKLPDVAQHGMEVKLATVSPSAKLSKKDFQ